MADKRDQWADSFSAEPQGWLTGILADEKKGSRRLLWRMASWGVTAVGAVTLAVLASRYQSDMQRDQSATSNAIAHQAQQLQQLTREAQVENRRLSQAIDTLNSDRDRLYTRVSSVEKNLESVTGSIQVKQQTPPPAPPRDAAPQVAAPATLPAPLPDLPAIPAQPAPPAEAAVAEPAPARPADPAPVVQTAAVTPTEAVMPVARTDFGVDIGTANSIDGLRAVWRGASKLPALAGLSPIIVVKERANGLGMQLRLVAGPLTDAAAAARICATLAETKRACETAVFDGQRLALQSETTPAAPAAAKPPRPAQPHLRRAAPKPQPAPTAPKPPEQRSEQPQPKPVEEAQAMAPPPPAPPARPSLSSMLGFSRE